MRFLSHLNDCPVFTRWVNLWLIIFGNMQMVKSMLHCGISPILFFILLKSVFVNKRFIRPKKHLNTQSAISPGGLEVSIAVCKVECFPVSGSESHCMTAHRPCSQPEVWCSQACIINTNASSTRWSKWCIWESFWVDSQNLTQWPNSREGYSYMLKAILSLMVLALNLEHDLEEV